MRRSFTLADQFGVRSPSQLGRSLVDLARAMRAGDGYRIGPSSAGLLRPDISLPAYAGHHPWDGLSPIFNLFDRVGGGRGYHFDVTRQACRDFRGGRLSYDEHDGTDFVCPPGTPLACAAPGVLVATRDSFLRGGLTACVDHGSGVVTQYTHLARMTTEPGQPLQRGETVGLSGTAGFDMLSGFPWVPPHVHFMVWVRGRPVDPYLAAGEALRPGTWRHGNDPRPSGPLHDDQAPPPLASLAFDEHAIERACRACRSPTIADELARAPSSAARVAILEDSLHHDRPAWPADLDPEQLRLPADASHVRLTLPLPAEHYRGARFADSPWTRPVRLGPPA
jgi:murein DD-endopeptidase MepM/ murein hydrolase activator NlpD